MGERERGSHGRYGGRRKEISYWIWVRGKGISWLIWGEGKGALALDKGVGAGASDIGSPTEHVHLGGQSN